MSRSYEILDADATGRAWIRERIDHAWGGLPVVSQSGAHDPTTLPALLAMAGDRPAGHATYRIDGTDCEIVTIESETQWSGVGTALLAAVEERARAAGCSRLWLNTTNDNLDALRFYQRRGFTIAAVHAGFADETRARQKPQMPEIGNFGIAIRDLLELERAL